MWPQTFPIPDRCLWLSFVPESPAMRITYGIFERSAQIWHPRGVSHCSRSFVTKFAVLGFSRCLAIESSGILGYHCVIRLVSIVCEF